MKKNKIKYIVKKLIGIGILILFSIIFYQLFWNLKNKPEQENYYGTRILAEEEETEKEDISDIIENAAASVVGISKIKNIGSSVFLSNSSEELGLGSGIIVSKKGYILTNEHVAGEKGKSCYITTKSGETYPGKIIWSNADIDLAIVDIHTICYNIASLGNSDSIKVGQNVYAIGNPIGYEFQRTVTGGIISAVNRTVKIKNNDESYSYMSNLIQTDATINPGNSGGPLINAEGKIIGINTIKIVSAEGIGFAIPINIVKPIIEKYEKYGEFKEAYLGIYAYDQSILSYVDRKTVKTGVYVEKIIENSPAYETQLQRGDQIIQIDTTNISTMSELLEYIFNKNPGDEIKLMIIRDQQEKEIKVVLGEK